MSTPEAPEKWLCTECLEVSFGRLEAQNPFDPEDTLCGCEKCKAAEKLIQACQHPGCEQPASGGYPGALGYRYAWLCYKHSSFREDTQ